MKNLGLKLLATAGALSFAGGAHAALIYSNVTYGDADAQAAEAGFLSYLTSYTTETFDSGGLTSSGVQLGAQDDGTDQGSWVMAAADFNTAVGTFTMTQQETSTSSDDVLPEYLMIEDTATGEFGRDAYADDPTNNWLDSNDADMVTWDVMANSTYNAIGFYLSDPNDQGASLVLKFNDGVEQSVYIDSPLSNGKLMYVTLFSDVGIDTASVIFDNGTGENDGWGIDNITVGKVPEPGTLALLALGVAGLGAARRKKA